MKKLMGLILISSLAHAELPLAVTARIQSSTAHIVKVAADLAHLRHIADVQINRQIKNGKTSAQILLKLGTVIAGSDNEVVWTPRFTKEAIDQITKELQEKGYTVTVWYSGVWLKIGWNGSDYLNRQVH